jgi:hypothetical protein
MLVSVRTASAQDAFRRGGGDTVSDCVRQFEAIEPAALRFWQNENRVGPDFLAAFPGHCGGKISAASDDQCAAARAGKCSGEADWVGQGREL